MPPRIPAFMEVQKEPSTYVAVHGWGADALKASCGKSARFAPEFFHNPFYAAAHSGIHGSAKRAVDLCGGARLGSGRPKNELWKKRSLRSRIFPQPVLCRRAFRHSWKCKKSRRLMWRCTVGERTP